jgi:glycerol-3-phosphate O-acyltransferase/dihydroxyacetone phosphate acyltransferase
MKGKVVYWVVYRLVVIALYAFFQKIVAVGRSNIPRKGPVIFAPNHPNMLLDPLCVGATCNRMDTHFWAKSTLFKGAIGWLFRQLGAIPVARRQDTTADQQFDPRANDKLFESSYEILQEGASLFIFPEGKSYTAAHIQEIKTGASRLVLNLLKKTEGKVAVPIVPVGLNYVQKNKFRSNVLISYGKPITVTAEDLDDPEASEKLTKKLQDALEQLTVNAPDFETLILINLARNIYTTNYSLNLEQHIELTQRLATSYKDLKDKDPEVNDLKDKLAQYHAGISDLHLKDNLFAQKLSAAKILRLVFTRSTKLMFYVLLSLPGAFIHLPAYYLARLGNKLKDAEDVSQFKFIILFLVTPMLWGLLSLGSWWLWGLGAAIKTGLLMPLFAWFHLFALQEGVSELRTVNSLLRLVKVAFSGNKTRIQELVDLRKDIHDRLKKLAEKYFPNTGFLSGALRTDNVLRANTNENFL